MLKVAKYTFKWLNLLLCALENKLLNLATNIVKWATLQATQAFQHFFQSKVTIHSPFPRPTAKAAVLLDFEHAS